MGIATLRHAISDDGAIHRVVLDGPPANIIGRTTCLELVDAVRGASSHPSARLIILTGEGRHFSTGAAVDEHLPGEAAAMLASLEDAVLALAACPVPVIAGVRGRCLGGGLELALACGIVVAEVDAVLAAPEVKLGVFAPAASALLARVAPAVAEDLLLTGREMRAPEAHVRGIVSRLVPSGQLDEALETIASEEFRPRSAASLRIATRAARGARAAELRQQLARERERYLGELLPLHDGTEGIRAFLAKRAPQWRHA